MISSVFCAPQPTYGPHVRGTSPLLLGCRSISRPARTFVPATCTRLCITGPTGTRERRVRTTPYLGPRRACACWISLSTAHLARVRGCTAHALVHVFLHWIASRCIGVRCPFEYFTPDRRQRGGAFRPQLDRPRDASLYPTGAQMACVCSWIYAHGRTTQCAPPVRTSASPE